MNLERLAQLLVFSMGICMYQAAVFQSFIYVGIGVLVNQVSITNGHPIGNLQSLPMNLNSVSKLSSGTPNSKYADVLSIMLLRDAPIALVLNSKGQIVGTISTKAFQAPTQTISNVPNVGNISPNRKQDVPAATKSATYTPSASAITVVKPKVSKPLVKITKPNTLAPGKTRSTKTVVLDSLQTGKQTIAVAKTAAAAAKQSINSIASGGSVVKEPIAVLNNSDKTAGISAKTTQKASKATTKVTNSTTKAATTQTKQTVRPTHKIAQTVSPTNQTIAPSNITTAASNVTTTNQTLATNMTEPATTAPVPEPMEGLEYGEDYTTKPPITLLPLGEGGEPLEPGEYMMPPPSAGGEPLEPGEPVAP